MNHWKKGDKVAWTMIDGNTMTGTVQQILHRLVEVKRVDGTVCNALQGNLRPATPKDIQDSIDFYTKKAS